MFDQYQNHVDNIMQREVNRGEFLKVVGVALLSFIGVVGFFKNLHEGVSGNSSKKSSGYGNSPYGK